MASRKTASQAPVKAPAARTAQKAADPAEEQPAEKAPAERRPAERLPSEGRKAQPLTRQLKDVLLQLQQVQSAVMVAVAALRAQACDLDEDIARVLQRAVAERLHEQMDLLEASLQVLARGKP